MMLMPSGGIAGGIAGGDVVKCSTILSITANCGVPPSLHPCHYDVDAKIRCIVWMGGLMRAEGFGTESKFR